MNITQVDHIGIRVIDRARAIGFYRLLGFEVLLEVDFDAVVIMKNPQGVEINLIINGQDLLLGQNILMDVPQKYPGFTHVALRVPSIVETMAQLKRHNIEIRQGPVTFGGDEVSVFIRDPDRNVIELRAQEPDLTAVPGLTHYQP